MKALTALPTSRKAATENSNNYYFTGKPCIHGHIAKRRTVTGVCAECYKLYMRDYWRRKHAVPPAAYRSVSPSLKGGSAARNIKREQTITEYLSQIAVLSLKITEELKHD